MAELDVIRELIVNELHGALKQASLRSGNPNLVTAATPQVLAEFAGTMVYTLSRCGAMGDGQKDQALRDMHKALDEWSSPEKHARTDHLVQYPNARRDPRG